MEYCGVRHCKRWMQKSSLGTTTSELVSWDERRNASASCNFDLCKATAAFPFTSLIADRFSQFDSVRPPRNILGWAPKWWGIFPCPKQGSLEKMSRQDAGSTKIQFLPYAHMISTAWLSRPDGAILNQVKRVSRTERIDSALSPVQPF
jgi:hypothetical protein